MRLKTLQETNRSLNKRKVELQMALQACQDSNEVIESPDLACSRSQLVDLGVLSSSEEEDCCVLDCEHGNSERRSCQVEKLDTQSSVVSSAAVSLASSDSVNEWNLAAGGMVEFASGSTATVVSPNTSQISCASKSDIAQGSLRTHSESLFEAEIEVLEAGRVKAKAARRAKAAEL